jgi:polyhydroxybutyrate depolymerase
MSFVRIAVFAGGLIVALVCVGCGGSSARNETSSPPSASHSAGTTHATLNVDGVTRTYRLFIPFGLGTDAKVPLVLALHGGLGSADQFAATTKFESLARDEGFIVAFPDGLDGTWNGGSCCGQSARKNVDDVGFLAALIQDLERTAPVDPTRVFVTGHSNGAIMAFRFGCERADLVKAIAPVAGSLETPDCKPTRGASLLAIHGDADQNHPIDGGQGPRSIAGVPFKSMADTLTEWTKAEGCGDSSRSTSGALTTTDWSGCRDGAVARFIVIAGADHPWPGGAGSILGAQASRDLDATTTVWDFFKSLR